MLLFGFLNLTLLFLLVYGDNHHQHHHNGLHSSQNNPIQSRWSHRHVKTRYTPIDLLLHTSRCHWVCDILPGNNTVSEIYINVELRTLAVLNSTALKAVILGDLITILDGKTGGALIVDLVNQKLHRITTDEHLWLSSHQNFGSYYFGLSNSFNELLRRLTSENHGEDLKIALPALTSEFSNFDSSSSLTYILEKLQSTASKSYALRALLVKSITFKIQHQLFWVVSINSALAELFSQANKTYTLKLNDINLESIYNADNGVEAFLNTLIEVGKDNDLSLVFGSILNNPTALLKILHDFSSASRRRVDLWIRASNQIVEILSGQGSVENLLVDISNLQNSGNLNVSEVDTLISKALNLTESQSQKFQNSDRLKGFTQILQQLRQHQFVFGNVNILEVLEIISSSHNGPIEVTSSILTKLGNPFGANGPQRLLESAFGFLNNTNDTRILSHLIPGFNVSQLGNWTYSGSILQSLFNSQNWTNLSSSSGLQYFRRIPVFGSIIEAAYPFGNSSNLSYNASSLYSNLQKILNGSGSGISNWQHLFNQTLDFGNILSNPSNWSQHLTNLTSSGGGLLNSTNWQDILNLNGSGVGYIGSVIRNSTDQIFNGSQLEHLNPFNRVSNGTVSNGTSHIGHSIGSAIKNSTSFFNPSHWAHALNPSSYHNITSGVVKSVEHGINTLFGGLQSRNSESHPNGVKNTHERSNEHQKIKQAV